MSAAPSLLVFTDLDGTLLDHDSYGYGPALPALDALKARGIPLVLASSKTAAEIAPLRAKLGREDCPAIVENGAGILPAHAAPEAGAADYARLRAVLDGLASGMRARFCGFGDMDAAGVAAITGLPDAQAALARRRAFSEPGVWDGTPAQEADFVAALAARGVQARRGGRFLTLSFGGTKADRMAEIVAQYRPRRTLALGDAPNDIEMLEAADRGVIVANPHGTPLPPLPGEADGRIRRTEKPGPDGWNAAVCAVLSGLGA
ncbi:HAD-IIB family hydrolase [Dinoroseobacter sp. PD6]|uniref:HAD-IIB family hydrolase n=1 Tax=Dinoroseobacter sp. PD6 TaxID=3028384 RepID=UPI00237BAFA6|nr:HAD-IIB family hydrolase [Dinoroseobacter sp. PD6]MDD9715338.1 HAD-IIB family hydrolase [Dinoroseobacter sp. PD6]